MSTESLNILLVDDDKSICYTLQRALTEKGHSVMFSLSGKEALNQLKQSKFDVMLLDLMMPDMGGTEILGVVKKNYPHTEVVIISGMGSMRTALSTLNMDAFDFLSKPIHLSSLFNVIERIQQKQHNISLEPTSISLLPSSSVPELIGKSQSSQKVIAIIEKISSSNSNVLIRGETGAGKEVVAHCIHNKSPRRNGPMIAINCSALPDTLLESELFGYEKGAFTDAANQKKGLLEMANGGTLFLDEIGEVPLALQAKLLRVVETKRFRRLGSTKEQIIDIRLLSATNRNLETAVKLKQFREDLFYRLSVISLQLPPLRERKEDIPVLVNHFLKTLAESGKPLKKILPKAMEKILSYAWPGNIRELQNIIEHAVVFSDNDTIHADDLPGHIQQRAVMDQESSFSTDAKGQSLENMEKNHIEKVIQDCGKNRSQAAKILGISERALYYKIRKYKIPT